MVNPMDVQGPYIEHIDSKEIKKLIDRIYCSAPEDVIIDTVEVQSDRYQDMIHSIDQAVTDKNREKQHPYSP